MADVARKVDVPDKFRSEFIVHFDTANVNRNLITMATEYAPCGSLKDGTKTRPSLTNLSVSRFVRPCFWENARHWRSRLLAR